MKKLAIVNCKSRKKDYTCEAEEMYSHSFQFRHQLNFIKEYYDDYLILSTKYGLITPNTVIEPYDLSIATGTRLKNKDSFTKGEKEIWGNIVLHNLEPYIKEYDIIDLHISKQYLYPIKSILKYPNVNHILQPNTPGTVKERYVEVLDTLKQNKPIDLSIIGEIRSTKYKKVNFYHPIEGKFFGNVDELVTKYPHVDPGNLGRVRRDDTKFKQTCGWVIHESLLPKLYQTDSGQWRLKK